MEDTRVVFKELPADALRAVRAGRNVLLGQPLSYWLAEIGGYQGEIARPSEGRRFSATLEPWRDRDPETTWLAVSFVTELPRPS